MITILTILTIGVVIYLLSMVIITKTTALDRAVVARAQADEVIVNEFLTKAQPRDLGTEIVTQGNPTHNHRFKLSDWDRSRFGSDLVNLDPDPRTPIAFPMGTWKELFRCECGTEKIISTRALI